MTSTPTSLSSTGWARLRRACTATIFIAATIVGVTVGVRAVDISPVAPAVAVSQSAAPVAVPSEAPQPTFVQPTPAVDQQQGQSPGPGRGGRAGGGRSR